MRNRHWLYFLRDGGHLKCFLDDDVNSTSWIDNKSNKEQPILDIGQAIQRLGGLQQPPTVWTEFSRLSQEYDVVNLGQGFPDWQPPQFAIEALTDAATTDHHQYTRSAGHPNLVNQLARQYSSHLQREINPFTEVTVTVGASQALYLCLQTLLQPGDEVLLFEPFFDLYVNQIKLAGGKPVYVPLRFVPYNEDDTSGGEWILDPVLLNSAINTKTKVILLNSPHNPTGKVFTRAEMESIATALQVHANPSCVVLSDEVYKYIIHAPPRYDNRKYHWQSPVGHTPFASMNPGLWNRTITISSAGKTFSATGWQIGWCIGPEHLMKPLHQLLPYVQFCASTVVQEALARALPVADQEYTDKEGNAYASYYAYLRKIYSKKRDKLATALSEAGFLLPNFSLTPGGGFFLFARIGKDMAERIPTRFLNSPNPAAPGGFARQDWALCQWLTEDMGLLCIPASPFFHSSDVADQFVRFAFCKTDTTFEAAASALQALHLAV